MDLAKKKCAPCEGGTANMEEGLARKYIKETAGWALAAAKPPLKIAKTFKFKNFKEVMAFLNKVAAVAEEEGHHPDIEASYKTATLIFWTHAINGLSENDFIMAAKVNALL